MNHFSTFKGTRYNKEKVVLKNVISPPYDVISTEQRDRFYEQDVHNVIRLELNCDADPYASAKTFLDEWKRENILIQDDTPGYYVYYQTFATPEGAQVTRRGILGRLKVTPYSEGNVLPHERTLPKAKEDRFKLLEAAHTNFSPIFGLIDDEALIFDHTADAVTANPPLADIDEKLASGQHVRHTMWRLTDPALVTRIEKLVAAKKIIIADGHHRYETSIAFAAAHPEISGAHHIMIYLANFHGEGTVILPTHRILHSVSVFDQYDFLAKLKKTFRIEIKEKREDAVSALSEADVLTVIQFPEEPKYVIVYDDDGGGSALQRLAVQRLHEKILKSVAGLSQEAIDAKTNLLYPHSIKELDEMTSGTNYDAAFILQNVSAKEMLEVTKEGNFMPQKSTFFYPKLLTGLVFHEFEVQG
jgi:uncharacterized protein (DUF1015 family)